MLKEKEKFKKPKEQKVSRRDSKRQQEKCFVFNSGVTLIALVVTITVLVILSAISINTFFGDNGLLNKANDAKREDDKARIYEIVMEKVLRSYSTNGELDKVKLLDNLRTIKGVDGLPSDYSYEFPLSFTVEGYNVEIDEWGNVTVDGKGDNTTPTEPDDKIKVTMIADSKEYKSGTWTNKDIMISLSSDELEGVTYQYSNDDGSSWNDCGSSFTIKTEQDKNYVFRAKLGTDYLSKTSRYNIKIDKTPPSVSCKSMENGFSTILIDGINASDNGGVVNSGAIQEYNIYYKETYKDDNNYIYENASSDTTYRIKSLNSNVQYTVKIVVYDNAGNEAYMTRDVHTACFVAGTQVLTEKGMTNIEDIKVGDKVWTISEKDNSKELKEVTKTFIGETNELYEITVGDEIIKATPKHRFYVVDKGWIRAYSIKEGDELVSNNLDNTIRKIEHKTNIDPVKIYNLTVEGNHNYLVTKYEVLVHNAPSILESLDPPKLKP